MRELETSLQQFGEFLLKARLVIERSAPIPPGVMARHRTSPFHPVQVPDLIGVRERRYLDRTGLQQHRSIEDLMRYAALNQGGDDLALFGGFRPVGELPDPSARARYSDEQLFALSLFLYSLAPSPNPNPVDSLARKGQKIFEREGCPLCHTPPLYTNNRLASRLPPLTFEPTRSWKSPSEPIRPSP
jgi:hypothetical protein